MTEPEIRLKDPIVAALLGFLVPGLGHLYQGRLFKAAIYAICIWGLFVTGLMLSEGKIVNFRGAPNDSRTRMISFAAQAGVGLPGIVALVQSRRYHDGGADFVSSLDASISSPFEGTLNLPGGDDTLSGPVKATIELAPSTNRFGDPTIIGRLVGTHENGAAFNVSLGEDIRLGPRIQNERQRYVGGDVIEQRDGRDVRLGSFEGAIPRGFWNWFLTPLSEIDEQELHRRLGKFHELALVFTWIAGLLNILAIWDAYEGPAYGYGLEPESPEGTVPANAAVRSAPAAAADPVAAAAGSTR
jgi:hypothetical protein